MRYGEKMEKHETLVAALAAALSDIGTIEQDAKGQYGKYANIQAVLSAVTPKLIRHGLICTQQFDGDLLVTTLRHVSGETIESRAPLIVFENRKGNPLHAWGAAVTYQRRYALLAILGIAAGMDDDDGDGADGGSVPRQKVKPAKPAPSVNIDDILTKISSAISREALEQVAAEIHSRELPPKILGVARKAWAQRNERLKLEEPILVALQGDRREALVQWFGDNGLLFEGDLSVVDNDTLGNAIMWLEAGEAV